MILVVWYDRMHSTVCFEPLTALFKKKFLEWLLPYRKCKDVHEKEASGKARQTCFNSTSLCFNLPQQLFNKASKHGHKPLKNTFAIKDQNSQMQISKQNSSREICQSSEFSLLTIWKTSTLTHKHQRYYIAGMQFCENLQANKKCTVCAATACDKRETIHSVCSF